MMTRYSIYCGRIPPIQLINTSIIFTCVCVCVLWVRLHISVTPYGAVNHSHHVCIRALVFMHLMSQSLYLFTNLCLPPFSPQALAATFLLFL